MSVEIAEFLGDDAEEPEIRVDDPLDQRFDLTELGIIEVEKGVCEDTYENRTTIRRAKMSYQSLYDQYGRATGLILAVSPESLIERRIMSLATKKPLMVDPENRNSDYLTGLDLILEDSAVRITPPWVIGSTRFWLDQENNGGVPPKGRKRSLGLPGRCRMIKTDTIRCMLWHSGRPQDDGLCRLHLKTIRGGKSTEDIERARKKLVQAAPYAVDTLEQLMDSAESEPVRLKASTEILDRAGIRGGQDFTVDMEVTDTRPASQVVLERIARLAEGAQSVQDRLEREAAEAEITDAEIVEEHSPELQIGTTSAPGPGRAAAAGNSEIFTDDELDEAARS
jgi:hypothetical protein